MTRNPTPNVDSNTSERNIMSTGNAWLDSKPIDKVDEAAGKIDGGFVAQYARADKYFGLWLGLADTKCVARFGLSIFDLSDYMWRDAFDGGMSPYDAMREALADDDIGALILAELS